ncbi:hypothetical protein [Sphingobacterium hotanense]|uniref:Uncharacterized protein n=1 Tax=Sphingobacterium hotanense TaxID=649196 RepID=A0ABT7NQ48_9SPHI|nr:hypothetical protein [Sphingobacterium hotanense]MDM1049374.1 hypothetical protein [Sphingobacterium hotanense]
MSTVKEVIVSMMGYKFPDATVNEILSEHGLSPSETRDTSIEEQTKAMDLSRADLIDFLITQPKTVKELDYQLTQQDADALLAIRRGILLKWGIDEDPTSSFTDLSNTH